MDVVNTNTPQGHGHKKEMILIVLAVFLVGAIIVYWYITSPLERPLQSNQPVLAPTTETQTLGSDIYEKSSNPIKDQLPGTQNPVSNPLENLYQNPFK